MTNDGLTLQISRVGQDVHGMCFIDFILKSEKSEVIDPKWVWLTQNALTQPIQGLILSSMKVNPTAPIHGIIEIMRNDITESKPLRLELRRKKLTYLTIQGVNGWKY